MSRPWFPFYVDRYLGDTTNLTTQEHGAYLLLMLHYWRQGALPVDEEELAAITRLPMSEWQKARKRLSRFFLDGWKHKRIEKELAEAKTRYERRADAGKKGGIAKAKSKQSSSKQPSNASSIASGNALANGYQPQSTSSSNLDDVSCETSEMKDDTSVKEVRRDQVSPSDPVLQRPDDELAAYSDAELKALAFEFDGLDVESAIRDLGHWATRRGITDPIERKSAIYGAMRKRHARAKLHDAMQVPATTEASPQLASSRLARADLPSIPGFLDRRSRPAVVR